MSEDILQTPASVHKINSKDILIISEFPTPKTEKSEFFVWCNCGVTEKIFKGNAEDKELFL